MGRFSKAIWAFLGGLTPAVVIALLALVHVTVNETVAAAIVTVVATISTILAPANTPKPASSTPC